MPIVRVPDVVVRELVDIRVRLAIAVDVHVGHGTCRMSHLLHRQPKANARDRAVYYLGG